MLWFKLCHFLHLVQAIYASILYNTVIFEYIVLKLHKSPVVAYNSGTNMKELMCQPANRLKVSRNMNTVCIAQCSRTCNFTMLTCLSLYVSVQLVSLGRVLQRSCLFLLYGTNKKKALDKRPVVVYWCHRNNHKYTAAEHDTPITIAMNVMASKNIYLKQHSAKRQTKQFNGIICETISNHTTFTTTQQRTSATKPPHK